MKSLAAEGRQQGGVDVDHAAGEVGGNLDELQKPGHHHEIGVRRPAGGEDRVAPGAERLRPRREHAGSGTPARRAISTPRTSPRLETTTSTVAASRPARDPVEQVFERPAGARKEHGEAERRGQVRRQPVSGVAEAPTSDRDGERMAVDIDAIRSSPPASVPKVAESASVSPAT